jgi:hypothetical protein
VRKPVPRKNPDLLDQHIKMQQRDRYRRIMFPCYSDTKTFLIAGDVAGVVIPPYIVSMTPALKYPYVYNDRGPEEMKFLKGYCGRLSSGTCSIRPTKNGDFIGPSVDVTSSKPTHWEPVNDEDLDDRDSLSFVITGGSGAQDLAASFVFEIRPGTVPGGPGSNQNE